MAFSPETRKIMTDALIFKPRQDIARVIFASPSHRGADMATNPMGRLGSKLIGAPKSMLNGDTAPAGYRRGQTHPPSPPRPTVRCPPATPFLADGKKVLARTAGIRYSAVLPGWMPWSRATTGENVLRTYEGEGRLLISTTPHWRYMIAQQRQTQDPADDLMMGSSHPAIPDIDPDFGPPSKFTSSHSFPCTSTRFIPPI